MSQRAASHPLFDTARKVASPGRLRFLAGVAACVGALAHHCQAIAGQERTHFKLRPGEEVRTPLTVVPFWNHARAKGVKTIVWFEPERVQGDTWLAENHPEWILGGARGGLLNLVNPEAHRWLTGHIDRLITEQGVDLYRQDFNIDPLSFWQKNDAEDRQGITENHHVTQRDALIDLRY